MRHPAPTPMWSFRTRVVASLAVLVVTIALLIGLVALAGLTNAYN